MQQLMHGDGDSAPKRYWVRVAFWQKNMPEPSIEDDGEVAGVFASFL